MTSLDHRVAYLGLADFDYLSARILLRHGLMSTGLPRAAESFEKILKLVIMLEARITRKEELEPKHLKSYGHDLPKLFAELKRRISASFPPEFDTYFAMLTDAYDRRYPEHWKSFKAEVSVDYLDGVYVQFRNSAVINFPIEEQARARQFGTFITDAYAPVMIKQIEELGGQTIGELLRFRNDSFDRLDIDQ